MPRLGIGWAALLATPLAGHWMSMSTGELRVRGERVEYALRVPLYEITHLEAPEKLLLENFRLFDGRSQARLVKHLCESRADQQAYLCRAEYQFPAAVENLVVECTFAAALVPHHVHLLRAEREHLADQAVFDLSFTRLPLRFAPPGRAARALSQMGTGALRAVAGPAQLLFLLALAMAARRRRELYALAASFLAAECASAAALAGIDWTPAPRFVEAAAALTVAYLAVEILLLPEAGHRWAVAGALGVFHGFYFGVFLRESQMSWLPVMAGILVAELALLSLFAALLGWLLRVASRLRPIQAGAGALLAAGVAWFLLRLRN